LLSINTDVVLVTKIAVAALSRPPSIDVFLGTFGLAPVFWNLTVLDPVILLARIPLNRHRDDGRINELPGLGFEALSR